MPFVSGVLEELGFVFGCERFSVGAKGCLSRFVELGGRGSAGSYGDADLGEEFFLSGWGAETQEADIGLALIHKLMRGVGGYVDGLAGVGGGAFTAEGGLDLALEEDEGFFKIVPVRGWAAAGWDVHVDEAELAGGVFAAQEDGVGIAHQAEVREVWIVGSGENEGAL